MKPANLPTATPSGRQVPDALLLAAAFVMAFSMWFYVVHILVPYQVADARLRDRPRGNLSDLYPRWLGARELLLHGRNPYSAEVTREIQAGYYGRPLDASRPNDPRDQQGFAYPAYVTFLLAPTLRLPFEPVRLACTWVLAALTAVSVWWWFDALGWSPGFFPLLATAILAVGSFPGLQGARLQQLSLLVAALMALSALLVRRDWLRSAGILLGFATIKPQLVTPMAGFLLLWSVSDWRERQRFFWGFISCVAALFVAAQVLLPGWFGDFLRALREYQQYTGGQSRLDVLLGHTLGRALAVVLVLITAFFGFRARRAAAGSFDFQLALALVLATTLVTIPTFAPYNQFLLLPAVLMVARELRLTTPRPALRVAAFAGAAFLGWQWLAALALTVASLFLAPSSLQGAWAVPLWTEFAIAPTFLLALFMLVGRSSSRPATPS